MKMQLQKLRQCHGQYVRLRWLKDVYKKLCMEGHSEFAADNSTTSIKPYTHYYTIQNIFTYMKVYLVLHNLECILHKFNTFRF